MDAALQRLVSGDEMTPEDLALFQLILDGGSESGAALALAGELTRTGAALEIARGRQQLARAQAAAMMMLMRDLEKARTGVGRGFSEFPRAPDHRLDPRYGGLRDRVSELRPYPEEFRRAFALYPDEFDQVLQNALPQLAQLSDRALDIPNRLALALRKCRKGKHLPMVELADWFGVGKTAASQDFHAVMDVLKNDTFLTSQISWPGAEEIDAMVLELANNFPNLAGAWAAIDGKKRLAHLPGRSFDSHKHKQDYESNKGHGRQICIICDIRTGKLVFISANFGARHEAFNYQDYECCREREGTYWGETLLPADERNGRDAPIVVKHTAIGAHASSVSWCVRRSDTRGSAPR